MTRNPLAMDVNKQGRFDSITIVTDYHRQQPW